MPDEKKTDTRPFWKKKTHWGLLLIAIGKTMTYFPVTAPFSPIIEAAGMIFAGYGLGDRISKK